MASPLTLLTRIGVLLGAAVAVGVAGQHVLSGGLGDLAHHASMGDQAGELRTPSHLPFDPTLDEATATPSPLKVPCAARETEALTKAGWTMVGHVWAAPKAHWRVEAFTLTPPPLLQGDDALARVRRADARCVRRHQIGAPVTAQDKYGYVVPSRPLQLRSYWHLANGRVEMLSILSAPGGPGKLGAAMIQIHAEAFTPPGS